MSPDTSPQRPRATLLGWHFLPASKTLRTGEVVETGQTYTATGRLILCQNGMHACQRALDALLYAPGSIVCRVRLCGEIILGTEKVVARSRRVLWIAEAETRLHEFAVAVATDALCFTNTADSRSWAALQIKTQWLHGRATDQTLREARGAAWEAAVAAARTYAYAPRGTAAEAAARAAAARAATGAAEITAWISARVAAWTATRAFAERAVGTTAWDPIGAHAWKATWEAYNVQLEVMLESLRGEASS